MRAKATAAVAKAPEPPNATVAVAPDVLGVEPCTWGDAVSRRPLPFASIAPTCGDWVALADAGPGPMERAAPEAVCVGDAVALYVSE